MQAFRLSAMGVAVAAMVAVTALLMGWPLERAIYLAPIIVIGFAAVFGLLILWGKVVAQHLQESRRPRLVITLWLLGIGLIVLLSYLGVELPREG
jgi:small basic protein